MTEKDHFHFLLLGEFQRRRERNPRYSLRAFARDIGVSPSRLSEVLSSKERFSVHTMKSVFRRLGWRHGVIEKCSYVRDLPLQLTASNFDTVKELIDRRLNRLEGNPCSQPFEGNTTGYLLQVSLLPVAAEAAPPLHNIPPQ